MCWELLMVDLKVRPSALPPRVSPVASEKIPSDNGAVVAGVTWTDGVNAARPFASQAQAEAGASFTTAMSPLTTKQHVDKRIADGDTVGAGSVTDPKVATPATVADGIQASKLRYNLTADTGFVYRSVDERLQEKISVKDFGAKGDGVTNDTTAIQLAINWAGNIVRNPFGATVYFPRGKYLITNTLTVNKDNVVLVGDGRLVSTIYRTNASLGNTVRFTKTDGGGAPSDDVIRGVGMRHMGFEQRGAEMTSGAHLFIRGALDGLFEDLNIDSGYVGMQLQGCARLHFAFIWATHQFGTNGLAYYLIENSSVTANPTPLDNHFYALDAQPLQAGSPVEYGLVIRAADGLYFTSCHVARCRVSLYIDQTVATPLSGLKFVLCWFDANVDHAMVISGTAASLKFLYGFSACTFSPNDSSLPNMEISGDGRDIDFDECTFQGSKRAMLSIGASVKNLKVNGGTMVNANTDNIATAGAIEIGGDNVSVIGLSISGSQTLGFGIYIASGAVGYIISLNNLLDLTGLATPARLRDDGGAVAKVVVNNLA